MRYPCKRPQNPPGAGRSRARSGSDQEWLRTKGPVEESLPDSQTWLGLRAADPIVTVVPGGSGFGDGLSSYYLLV
jgi:hypothetical protein